jgi:transcription factor IIIB subunit 2
MHKYTAALASRLGHSGLAARVQLLFDQAMRKGQFRWGRKAKLVAGASMAIALREAHKGETLRDISVRYLRLN